MADDRMEAAPAPCERSRFLETLLDDEERGRLASVEDYVAGFPGIAAFVRTEYAALCGTTGSGAAPSAPSPPTQIGRYQVRGPLSEGGMGRIYDAFDPQLGRRVVLKTLRNELGPDAQAADRLRREARVLGQLSHPNLAKVLDVLEVDGRAHLVMAFHEGRTLADHLGVARGWSDGGASPGPRWLPLGPQPCEPAEALRRLVAFFVRAAEALHSAHEAGIVHRDVKPQNLIVGPDGSPIVLDFGLALPEGDERLTVAGELLGTPLYMAPEQVEGGATNARTDVYALGVTLYEALTLVHPFAGSGGRTAAFARILRGDPVTPRRHQPLVPRDLEAVVLRAIDRRPAQRYPDMAAFARDLQRVLDLEPTEARPMSGVGQAWRRVRRRPKVAVLGVVTLVAMALAAWNYARVREKQALGSGVGAAANDVRTIANGIEDPRVREALLARAALLDTLAVEVARSEASSPDLLILFPRGKVLGAQHFVWRGVRLRSAVPELKGWLTEYDYRITVMDGARTVAEWIQPHANPILRSVPSTPLDLVAGRRYLLRIGICDFRPVADPEVPPAERADWPGLTLAEVKEANPPAEVWFELTDLPSELRASDPLDVRVTTLLRHDLAADALALLHSPEGRGLLQHDDLVQQAARSLLAQGERR